MAEDLGANGKPDAAEQEDNRLETLLDLILIKAQKYGERSQEFPGHLSAPLATDSADGEISLDLNAYDHSQPVPEEVEELAIVAEVEVLYPTKTDVYLIETYTFQTPAGKLTGLKKSKIENTADQSAELRKYIFGSEDEKKGVIQRWSDARQAEKESDELASQAGLLAMNADDIDSLRTMIENSHPVHFVYP